MTRVCGTSRAAVLIPLYKDSMTATEKFSFKNTLSVLSNHDIYVICPKQLTGYLSALKNEILLEFNVESFPDRYFSSVSGYSSLLMTIGFYRRFSRYEFVLIVQTDALVFSDQLEEWCKRDFSYIGAPWFHGLEYPSKPYSFIGVGNGGFSLRKVRDFVKVLTFPRYLPVVSSMFTSCSSGIIKWLWFVKHRLVFAYSYNPFRPKINEDIFWGTVVSGRCDFFSVPTPEEAIPFAFEVAPEYLFKLNGGRLPFGCHAWEKNNLLFWRDILGRYDIDLP